MEYLENDVHDRICHEAALAGSCCHLCLESGIRKAKLVVAQNWCCCKALTRTLKQDLHGELSEENMLRADDNDIIGIPGHSLCTLHELWNTIWVCTHKRYQALA